MYVKVLLRTFMTYRCNHAYKSQNSPISAIPISTAVLTPEFFTELVSTEVIGNIEEKTDRVHSFSLTRYWHIDV